MRTTSGSISKNVHRSPARRSTRARPRRGRPRRPRGEWRRAAAPEQLPDRARRAVVGQRLGAPSRRALDPVQRRAVVDLAVARRPRSPHAVDAEEAPVARPAPSSPACADLRREQDRAERGPKRSGAARELTTIPSATPNTATAPRAARVAVVRRARQQDRPRPRHRPAPARRPVQHLGRFVAR